MIDKTNGKKPVESDFRRDVESILRFTIFSGMYDRIVEYICVCIYIGFAEAKITD